MPASASGSAEQCSGWSIRSCCSGESALRTAAWNVATQLSSRHTGSGPLGPCAGSAGPGGAAGASGGCDQNLFGPFLQRLADLVEEHSGSPFAGPDGALHVAEMVHLGVLTGEEQPAQERFVQLLTDSEDLPDSRRCVSRPDKRLPRPVDEHCLTEVLLVFLLVEIGQAALEVGLRRRARAGEHAEHDVLALDPGLVVGALPDLPEAERAAVRRKAVADPEPLLDLAEELHRRPHSQHPDHVL